MSVGYGVGWTAPIIPKLQNPDETPLPDVISETDASWIGSFIYVGAIIGPHITGRFSNTIGRKPCLVIGGVINAISYMMVTFTKSLTMIFVLRTINGLGIGITLVGNLVYVSELASTNVRGALLTSMGLFVTVGALTAYSVGPFIPFSSSGYLGLFFSILYVLCIYFIPESPVFEILRGNVDAAKQILKRLGRDGDMDMMLAIKDIGKEENGNNKTKKSVFKEIFTTKSNRKALVITLVLGILVQTSGIVAVVFYATTIFELAGSSIRPDIATIVIGVIQLASSCVVPYFVERFGRKTLLLVSSAMCSLSLMILGTYFLLNDINHTFVEKIGWIPLVSLAVFFIFYEIGLGSIPGTLIGEMFSANVKSTGSALTITTGWLAGFGTSTAFGYMITYIGGHFTFWIYSVLGAVAFFFTLVCVPETKGKTLIEIQEMLSK